MESVKEDDAGKVMVRPAATRKGVQKMGKAERVVCLVLTCVTSVALLAPGVSAQWIVDGTALCTATADQLVPTIASDGAGGAIVTWEDYRGGNYDIYAQRVNGFGVDLWTVDGVPLCTDLGSQEDPTIVSDGVGGAIVTWHDNRGGNYDIYAQRVDASGVAQWTADGIALCTAAWDQKNPKIISDGAAGAVVVWRDDRSGNADIYVQRVDASGVAQWTADGVALCTALGDQLQPTIVPDGAGGAIVTWEDGRTGLDIYAQRVDASGVVQWTADGEPLCTATGNQGRPTIASDDAGGAIVTWYDERGGLKDIYAQRVDGSGAVQWTANGEVLCAADDDQNRPEIISDGAGGAIVVWGDDRGGSDRDIYAQRVGGSGSVVWTANGVALCTATGDQRYHTIVSDGASGAVVTWHDERSGFKDIYAQRVGELGVARWTTDGVALCTATGDQLIPTIVSDGGGGAIVTWQDQRGGVSNDDIYAQRVTRDGHWGYPAPLIVSVADVPGDEGGVVWIEFDASRLDAWPYLEIYYYSVWRSLSSPYALVTAPNAIELSNPAQATADMVGDAFCTTAGAYWQLVGTMDANVWPGYGYAAATLRDSTSVDPGWEYYFVAAHGSGDFAFWDSPPDSGYSTDDLSPEVPAALAAEYIGGSDLYLHWNPNTEVDLHHYAVYRGAAPDFVPDEISLIGTATDTFHVETGYGYGGEYYYKVSAIDLHENESAFALLTPDMITGVPGERRHYDNVLFQNSPNPFPSSTRIVFSMREAGHVRLRVFDAKGRLVRVLVDEVRQASKYIESWDGRDGNGKLVPAGMYFYRLEAAGWKASKKMTLAR